MSGDDWDTVLNMHLRGSFLMSRSVQKHMVDQRYGQIVNLSSSSALGNWGQANYSAAKADMQGLAKTLAIELGQVGITANAVAPGFIATDMTAATAARLGMTFEDFRPGDLCGRRPTVLNGTAPFSPPRDPGRDRPVLHRPAGRFGVIFPSLWGDCRHHPPRSAEPAGPGGSPREARERPVHGRAREVKASLEAGVCSGGRH